MVRFPVPAVAFSFQNPGFIPDDPMTILIGIYIYIYLPTAIGLMPGGSVYIK
jgi:hypothetical protein